MKNPRAFPSALAARCLKSVLLITALVAVLPTRSSAAAVTLRPSKDNTIYGNGSVNLSNGRGEYLFAGSSGPNGGNRALRSLIAFDFGGQIPAGATINSVTLTLAINTPLGRNANTVRLHRVTADWGEGSSVAPMGGGGGAPATTGDATWNARIFNTANWTTPGGGFRSRSERIPAGQRKRWHGDIHLVRSRRGCPGMGQQPGCEFWLDLDCAG